MNAAELLHEAKGIIPPVGASRAICVVDDALKHRAAFLVHGRIRSAPVGPAFARPRDAIRLADLLNGETPAANAPGQGGPIAQGVAPGGGSRSASHLPGPLRASDESVAVRDPVQSSLRTGVRLGPTSLGH